jgi:hypothetical protein
MRHLSSIAVVAGLLGSSACVQVDDSGGAPSLAALATEACQLLVGCCGNAGSYDDVKACTDARKEQYEADRQIAVEQGLEYDAACATRFYDWMQGVGCDVNNEEAAAAILCALGCELFHGDLGPGEACQSVVPRGSNCASGLWCVGGTCQDNGCGMWRLAEGATCYDPADPVTGTCVVGTYCELGGSNRCVVTPKAGEPCPQGVCEEGHFCDNYDVVEGLCRRLGAVGEMCLVAEGCETGYCTDDRFAAYPGVGEPCSGECAGDLYCQQGVCAVRQGFGQPCDDVDLPCELDLSCEGGVCQDGVPLICFGG